jgi:hypothetical protein
MWFHLIFRIFGRWRLTGHRNGISCAGSYRGRRCCSFATRSLQPHIRSVKATCASTKHKAHVLCARTFPSEVAIRKPDEADQIVSQGQFYSATSSSNTLTPVPVTLSIACRLTTSPSAVSPSPASVADLVPRRDDGVSSSPIDSANVWVDEMDRTASGRCD